MLFTRRQINPFILLFQGRSGSTWLISGLGQHPEVFATSDEILIPVQVRGSQAQLATAKEYLRAPIVSRHKARGFKTKLTDLLDRHAFSGLVRQLNASVVLLSRRNRIKLVVSWMNGERLYESTGRWTLYDGSSRPRIPFVIDEADFQTRLALVEDQIKEMHNYAQQLGVPIYALEYEDLLLDWDGALASVCKFLGVAASLVRGASIKNTDDDLRRVIANFEDLRDRFAGTKYESMFDEVLVRGDSK